jgi:hypothetical protein
MQRSPGALRDIKAAASAAAIVELLLASIALRTASELTGSHFWLEVTQMPGAEISERLFGHTGLIAAIPSVFLIQWIIFTVLILGCVYCYRIVKPG